MADKPVWTSRKSLRPVIPTVVVFMLLAAAAGYVALARTRGQPSLPFSVTAGVLASVALLIWLGAWIGRLGTEYRIGPQSTFLRQGFLSRRTAEIRIRDIRSINMNQTIWGRIIGVGDVLLGTSGQEGVEIVFRGVNAPAKVVAIIQSLRDKQPAQST